VLTINNTKHFRIEKPIILTIGTFDGVHLGHQKILNRLVELKKSSGLKTVVLTFEPHPRKVLFPEQTDLKLITLTNEKLELLAKYKVDCTVVYPFDEAFSKMDVDDYIKTILVKQLNVKYIIIGYDHKFGKDRLGDINVLKKHEANYNFKVEEIAKEDIDSITISSSNIRKSLISGDIEKANFLLGHFYSLKARVVAGKKLGREIGFPTANLKIENDDKLIPKIGVYFVEIILDSQNHFGMLNIGHNPTIDADQNLKLEVNIFNFNQDIYSKSITINFIKRLRDEIKFNSLNDLVLQLNRDKESCLSFLS
jgi:riboflavin kinase/FMN adenylyltransferase